MGKNLGAGMQMQQELAEEAGAWLCKSGVAQWSPGQMTMGTVCHRGLFSDENFFHPESRQGVISMVKGHGDALVLYQFEQLAQSPLMPEGWVLRA